jgi:hypothetical protein
VHVVIQNPDGSLKLSGPSYYLFFAGLSAAAAVVFAFVAMGYRGRTHLQDALPADAPPSASAPAA